MGEAPRAEQTRRPLPRGVTVHGAGRLDRPGHRPSADLPSGVVVSDELDEQPRRTPELTSWE